jgi:excisionase family DNA binding protein
MQSVLDIRSVPDDATPPYLTVTEVARIYRVRNGTILRWIAAGGFPGAENLAPHGQRANWRIPRSALRIEEPPPE